MGAAPGETLKAAIALIVRLVNQADSEKVKSSRLLLHTNLHTGYSECAAHLSNTLDTCPRKPAVSAPAGTDMPGPKR